MGSASFGVVVQATGEEKDMYKAIINYLTGLDSRITCLNDPDDEFDADTMGPTYVPEFNFSINNSHAFKLYRPYKLKDLGMVTPVSTIKFAMDAVSGIPDNDTSFGFRPDGNIGEDYNIRYTTEATRGIIISHIINADFIFLSFSMIYSDETLRGQNNGQILWISSSNAVYLSSSKSVSLYNKEKCFDLSNYELYNSSNLTSGTFISRFSYASPPGNIDYIKSSIYQNNNQKAFELKQIYDCSTVTIGDTISLKDGAYVSVGTNQLVKIR